MNDSGKRQSFNTGSVRDTADGKPRIDLLSPFALERAGHWMRLGAEKYAERNWELGQPHSRYIASLHRHLNAFQQGKRDEDHLAAIIFNAQAIMHQEEMISRGELPSELDDMPRLGVENWVKKACDEWERSLTGCVTGGSTAASKGFEKPCRCCEALPLEPSSTTA